MAAWSKFVFSILRTECRDQFPSYCRERIARHPRKSACNKHGSKMCPKSCGVCGKWRKTFLYAEDEVLIFATFWWWIINWTMKNSRSRLVIRDAISELIEQLTRHAAPCLWSGTVCVIYARCFCRLLGSSPRGKKPTVIFLFMDMFNQKVSVYQILSQLWLIGNRILCSLILSKIVLVL